MTRKTSSRTPVRTKISPLLGALTRAAPVDTGANPLLLKAFIALDALHRGQGTRGVFTVLGQQLVISERLCAAGYEVEMLRTVREAHAAMVRIDHDAQHEGVWKIAGEDYTAVCNALEVYERQLSAAPRNNVMAATRAMVGMLETPIGSSVPRAGRA